MNVANLELCKELYELSGWELPKVGACWWYVLANGDAECFMSSSPLNTDEVLEKLPAYDLGYLLRKIPYYIKTNDARGSFELFIKPISNNRFAAGYNKPESGRWLVTDGPSRRYVWECFIFDTPEDALAELAIELFKQGVLVRAS